MPARPSTTTCRSARRSRSSRRPARASTRSPASCVSATSNSLLGATLALFDLPTAQKLFDREGEFDAIYVKGDGGVSPDQLAPASPPCCPTATRPSPRASAAAEQQDQVGQGLGFLRTFFLIFGFVALFVGAFIIFNTFNIVVSQRSRELALFRALGARRRQVMTSVMIESAIVGLVASLGGILARHGPRDGPRRRCCRGSGCSCRRRRSSSQPRTIIVSIVLGTGITMAAAYPPARRAGRLAPLEALRESSGAERARSGVGSSSGSLITIAGIAAIGLALFGDVSNAGLVVGLGAALTFLGVAMLSPLFAKPISAGDRPSASAARSPGRLGGENANRNPRRTASTAAALMIGLGLVAFVAVFAASLKASATATLDRGAAAPTSRLSSNQFAPFSPQLAKDLSADSRVLHRVGAPPGRGACGLLGHVHHGRGPGHDHLGHEHRHGVGVGRRSRATEHGDRVPDRGRRQGPVDRQHGRHAVRGHGDQPLRVVGTFETNGLLNDYAVSLDTYDANVAQVLDQAVFVNVADGVPVEQAKADLDALLEKDYPGVPGQRSGGVEAAVPHVGEPVARDRVRACCSCPCSSPCSAS